MEADQAVKFIQRMFSHAAHDRMAILAIPRSEGKAEQRVFTLPQATSRKVQGWLRHLNARDYDIYLCVNPVQVGSGGREKEDIAEIRRLQLDLDEDGAAGLARVFEDVGRGELPRPAHVLRSSKERYQILWDTVPGEWEMEGAEAVMRALAARYGGDRAATDVARVMRMPGFRNKKPGRGRGAHHLGLARGSAGEAGGFSRTDCAGAGAGRAKWGPAPDAARSLLPERAGLGGGGRCAQERRGSETVISRLEQQRQDKPNPGYYARRTVRRKEEELKRGLPDQRKRA